MSFDTHRKEALVNATKELLDAMFCISDDAFNKIQTLVEPGFSGFGTGRDEVIHNLDDYLIFFKLVSEQLPGMRYDILRITPKLNGTTGIVEGELNILLKIGQDVVEVYGRFTFVFAQKEERWIALSGHTSVPMADQSPGEALPFDALKAKNEELKQLVAKRTALLQQKTEDLEEAILTLKATQAQLIETEKIASLGELTASIARDLHDDIGSTLNATKIFVHMALSSPNQAGHYFENVRENLDAAIVGLRDMMWILDDAVDTVESMIDRLKSFYQPLVDAKNIALHFSVAPEVRSHALSKKEKRNLLLIVKEAVNNSIKYADCRNIALNVTCESKKLAVEILDDGKGFEVTLVSQGYGLKNIKHRAEQIGYQASIASEQGKGTQILLLKK